jgi:hypothetical protein
VPKAGVTNNDFAVKSLANKKAAYENQLKATTDNVKATKD